MSSDNQFTALGPAIIGFQTDSASIEVGADISGTQGGVRGRSQGPGAGDGVQGFGSGAFSGVAGFGANVNPGETAGTGVIGLGGTVAETFTGEGAAGVRGIGGGGPNTSPSLAAGVYGQGGVQSPGVVGQAGTSPADGVQGFGTGNFSGVAGFGGAGAGTGVFGAGGGTAGQGVRGIGAGGPNLAPSSAVGVYGQAGPGADGVQGVGSGTSAAGVHGISQDSDGNGVIGDASNGPSAFAIWGRSASGFAGVFDGKVQINGPLNVTGPKSAIVSFPDGSHRRLYSIESPESWFEDFGFAQLVKSRAQVELDPGFAAVVSSDVYHVFITEYGANNALYVTQRTATGFSVRASSSPTASSEFSYRVVAKRKDIAGPRLEEVTAPAEKLTAAQTEPGVLALAPPPTPARPLPGAG